MEKFVIGLVGVLLAWNSQDFLSKQNLDKQNSPLVLWEISREDLHEPSYLLGSNHVVGKGWLSQFSEINEALKSSDVILTEIYGDKVLERDNIEEVEAGKNDSDDFPLAIDVLSKDQYAALDTFFLNRVGEGISNNPVAESMTVLEMNDAIRFVLINSGLEFQSMDLELYELFKNSNKEAVALDKDSNLNFSSKDLDRAQKSISLFVENAMYGSKEWNMSDSSSSLSKLVEFYKNLKLSDYRLDENDPEIESMMSNQTVSDRNTSWIPSIELNMKKEKCLIVVGLNHLRYKTGLITLLRVRGFTVKPIYLSQKPQEEG